MYFVSFRPLKVGTHKLFIRARRGKRPSEKASRYPIQVRVWSDLASRVWSEGSILARFVGSMSFTFVAKDRYGNSLTDNGARFNASAVFSTYGRNPYPSSVSPVISPENDGRYTRWATPDSFEQIDLWRSIYAAAAYPTLRGQYNVHIYVCERPENACSG